MGVLCKETGSYSPLNYSPANAFPVFQQARDEMLGFSRADIISHKRIITKAWVAKRIATSSSSMV